LLIALLTCALLATAAQAPARSYVIEFSPASLPQGSTFSLNGDTVTGFSAIVRPTNCDAPSTWRQDTDSVFLLQMTPGATVALDNGQFTYSGTAAAQYFGAISSTAPGGQFTVSGTVSPDHTLVTGTVTLTDANDSQVTDCSGTYRFIAIPMVPDSLPAPNHTAYKGRNIDFDYGAGVLSRFTAHANFKCGNAIDSANVTGGLYGQPTLQAGPSGNFSFHGYVLDQNQLIVSFRVTGSTRGKRASGRYIVGDPPGGFAAVGGERCAANHGWHSVKHTSLPARAPTAYLTWAPARVLSSHGYAYYFAVHHLSCRDRANKVQFTIARHHTIVPCSSATAYASGPLAPLRSYTVGVQALVVKGSRVIGRGPVAHAALQLPGAQDSWPPV
jgi:hypothetical protein